MMDKWIEPPIDEVYQEEAKASQPRNRFVIRDAAYALTPREPMQYIIDKIIAPASVNVWDGKFGSGKTYAALDAAVCVANGAAFLDMVTKQTAVLIIDEESGDRRLSGRLAATLRGHDADETTQVYFVSLAGFNLLKSAADVGYLRACIEETQAGLVIIDALADIMLGGDENAVKDTQPVFAALRSIAEDTNAAIVLIHHTNKAGEYRGSSAIPGAIDTMLLIEKDENSNLITFKTVKNRDGEPVKFSAMAHWDEERFYLMAADEPEKEPAYGRAQNYVLRYLKEHGSATLHEIMGAADSCTATGAKLAVYSLADLGLIRRINPNTNIATAAVYGLAGNTHDD